MKCNKCGSEIKGNDKFCTNCGEIIKQKKNDTGLIIGIIVLVVVALIAILVTLNKKQTEPTPTNETQEAQTKVTEETQVEEPKLIEFKGYKYSIPTNMTASVSGDKLFIYGPKSKWVGVVMTQAGSYDTLVSVKEQIKTALSAQEGAEKYDISNAVTEEKVYGGKPFLVTKNIISENYKLDISYGKADDNTIYVISVTENHGEELTETERTEMYSIVAGAEKIS
ncbi:MAG: zinc ribbon domain-containing protein [Bacilli bacterium]|nr:zinc ribbon domain-containing protein [Bacilli bacterium]